MNTAQQADGRVEGIRTSGHNAVLPEELSRSRGGRLAVKDLSQCFSLSRIRPFVDDDLLGAVALGDLTRPVHERRVVQAVETGVVEVSLLDVAGHERLAVPLG